MIPTFDEIEAPIIIIGDIKDHGIYDPFITRELDNLADQFENDLGLAVVRMKGVIWPRNYFYSRPESSKPALFIANDLKRPSRNFQYQSYASILGNPALFYEFLNFTLVSNALLRNHSQEQIKALFDIYLQPEEILFFNVTPFKQKVSPYGPATMPFYPHLGCTNTSIDHLDYVTAIDPQTGIMGTQEIFIQANSGQTLDRLAEYGITPIALPDEEFILMAQNFEYFYDGLNYFIVINKEAQESIATLISHGVDVIETRNDLELCTYGEKNFLIGKSLSIGGGVRCLTNKLYASSKYLMPDSLREMFVGLERYV